MLKKPTKDNNNTKRKRSRSKDECYKGNAPEPKSSKTDQYEVHRSYANLAIDNNMPVEDMVYQQTVIDHAANIEDTKSDNSKALAKDLRKASKHLGKKK